MLFRSRTFHVGGTASTSSEETKLVFNYPVVIGAITGTRVVRASDSVMVFTRQGHIEYFRVNAEIHRDEYDELLVEDGSIVGKGTPIFKKKGKTILSRENGSVMFIGKHLYLVGHSTSQVVKTGSELLVKSGQYVEADTPWVTFDPFSEPVLAEEGGFTSFIDIKLGTTLHEEVNEETGNIEKKITEHSLESLQPRIEITSEEHGKGDVLAV